MAIVPVASSLLFNFRSNAQRSMVIVSACCETKTRALPKVLILSANTYGIACSKELQSINHQRLNWLKHPYPERSRHPSMSTTHTMTSVSIPLTDWSLKPGPQPNVRDRSLPVPSGRTATGGWGRGSKHAQHHSMPATTDFFTGAVSHKCICSKRTYRAYWLDRIYGAEHPTHSAIATARQDAEVLDILRYRAHTYHIIPQPSYVKNG